MNKKHILLSFECLLLFGVIPGLLVWFQLKGDIPFFPVLFSLLIVTLVIAWRDPDMKLNPDTNPSPFKGLLIRLLAATFGLCIFTALLYPSLYFRLPRENAPLWGLILIMYPILSVAPQEFIFRSYFMQRYRPLFGDGTMICLVNALVFSWAHAFFLNGIAPLLTFPAGWFLARTWQQSNSFKRVCLEHAVYGQIVFTCGLGWFFFQGSSRTLQNFIP